MSNSEAARPQMVGAGCDGLSEKFIRLYTDLRSHRGSSMRDAALAFAELGFEIVPVREKATPFYGAKAPYLRKGAYRNASSDVEQVGQWWDKWPFALIGLRPPEGVVIVDIDPQNYGTLEAVKELAGGDLPATLTVRSGGGGLHLYYRYDPLLGKPSKYLRRVDGSTVVGVDVLTGQNSYIIAPPSLHPDSHKAYEICAPYPMAELPATLVAATRPYNVAPDDDSSADNAPISHSEGITPRRGIYTRTRQVKGAHRLIEIMRGTPEGSRHTTLFRTACTLYKEKHSPALIEQLKQAAIESGLGATEVQRTIQDARRNVLGGEK